MDALIIVAIALIVVIGAFYALGVGRPHKTTSRPTKNKGAYSKRARNKR
ncbi:hypothetical protein [Desulfoplanes formicivorans]|uniref:Uncharacterized protein n=1 Tax=Desulfoplanes formicivorans TaxID=1592317 RepID=A0A194AGI3_9BACT|nr:hypothetical protein [Desulfoplanes formicivorans]GAU08320.1 hypothetical protein DPF_1026 [Desulfoplanes formicivorans]